MWLRAHKVDNHLVGLKHFLCLQRAVPPIPEPQIVSPRAALQGQVHAGGLDREAHAQTQGQGTANMEPTEGEDQPARQREQPAEGPAA